MNLQPKYELAVVGVPAVVKEWANKNTTITKSKSRYETCVGAYKLGNQHGLEYEVKKTWQCCHVGRSVIDEGKHEK